MLRNAARSLFVLALFALSPSAHALPDGEGKVLVEAVCGTCHSPRLIERSSGYTREDWQALTATMIDLSRNREMEGQILDYLAGNFPPSGNQASTPVEGDLSIRFEQWQVPTLGQRSRDPVEAPDGGVSPADRGKAALGQYRAQWLCLVHRQSQCDHWPV